MFESEINSSKIKEIILLFNDFYNMFLNGIIFENIVDLYINNNLELIYNKNIKYTLNTVNTVNTINTLNKNIVKTIQFNNIIFGYIEIEIEIEIEELNLFIQYLSMFFFNAQNLKSTNIINCNLFTETLNMMNDGIIIMNEKLNTLFINKVCISLFEKLLIINYININIYDLFSQIDEYINENNIYKNKKINYKINKNNTDFNMFLTINTVIHNNIKYHVMSINLIQSDNKICDNIGFLSHELRNPLQTISFANELIKIKKEQKYFDIINKSVNDMIKIINDVLDIDRINSNQIQLNITDININELINEIEFSIPKNKNIKFTLIKSDLPNKIYTDSTRLKQILLNIINNSIKYSKQNITNNIIFKITHNKNNNTIEFSILDNGIGIKKEHISELMELKPSLSLNKNNSNGIGLYLCNKLAYLLGGNIKINSEYLNFTEIIFTHPLNLLNNYIINKNIENFKIFNKILIVDNDIILLNLFKDIITNLKIKYNIQNTLLIDMCDNENLIYDMVKINNYDIIFIDLYMSDINGITITKLLRKQYFNNKIIGMTTNACDIYSNDSLTSSIYQQNIDIEKVKIIELYDDIILKPFNENDILDKLKY
jgi:signal transduction histidine kinase